jgi:hypothetical protein
MKLIEEARSKAPLSKVDGPQPDPSAFPADESSDDHRCLRGSPGRSTIVSCRKRQSYCRYVRNDLSLFVEGSSTMLIRNISRMANITAGRSTFARKPVWAPSCPTRTDFIGHIESQPIKPGCRSNKDLMVGVPC